ncbi:MAG: LacI family DNA-binding transcriptional regulator [bacterium]
MGVTMQDIADELKVSRTTVYRVLNSMPHVREETRKAVLGLVHKYDYQPSLLAQGLRNRRTETIGVLYEDFTQPVWVKMVDFLLRAARARSHDIILATTREAVQGAEEQIERLIRRGVDGILVQFPAILGERGFRNAVEKLRGGRFPLVFLAGMEDSGEINWVSTDRALGAYKAVRHLIGLGHRRIAFAGWQINSNRYPLSQRLKGYKRALEEAGIPFREELVIPLESHPPHYYYRDGYDLGCRIAKMSPKPTSIFFLNDTLAIGALLAFQERGIRVPQDIAVVGFDDVEASAYASVPLTTVAHPVEEIAEGAVRMLLEIVENPDTPPRQLNLEPRLIVRRSCGAKLKGR